MKWNNGVSFPIGSGHPCIGCSEENFWDNGPFYHRLSSIPAPGIDSTPDAVGKTLVTLTGIGVAAHLASYLVRRASGKELPGSTLGATEKSAEKPAEKE
jgi:hydrogenase small subunit